MFSSRFLFSSRLALFQATAEITERLKEAAGQWKEVKKEYQEKAQQVNTAQQELDNLGKKTTAKTEDLEKLEKALDDKQALLNHAKELSGIGFGAEDIHCLHDILTETAAVKGMKPKEAVAVFFQQVDNYQKLVGIEAEIKAAEISAENAKADVSKTQDVRQVVEETINKYGKIDILINDAGVSFRKKDGRRAHLVEINEEEWDKVLAVNLTGVFNCCKQVLPHMIKRNYGNIISISSSSAKLVDLRIPSAAHYNASKAGVSNLTMSLAHEVASYGIRVNAIAPGRIVTPMAKTSLPEIEEGIRKATPMGRAGKPEEIAKVVLFLASHMSSYITGEVIAVNGGLFMD